MSGVGPQHASVSLCRGGATGVACMRAQVGVNDCLSSLWLCLSGLAVVCCVRVTGCQCVCLVGTAPPGVPVAGFVDNTVQLCDGAGALCQDPAADRTDQLWTLRSYTLCTYCLYTCSALCHFHWHLQQRRLHILFVMLWLLGVDGMRWAIAHLHTAF
jgi:hypothetical protein